jgi:hypothetical protein
MKTPILLLLLLCACGPASKLRRAKKLQNEAIAQGATVRVDTIYKERQIEVKGPHTTLTVVRPGKDTVIFKDRIRVIYTVKNDTITERIECPDSVVQVKEAVAVNQTISCPPDKWKMVALVLGGILLAVFGFIILKR